MKVLTSGFPRRILLGNRQPFSSRCIVFPTWDLFVSIVTHICLILDRYFLLERNIVFSHFEKSLSNRVSSLIISHSHTFWYLLYWHFLTQPEKLQSEKCREHFVPPTKSCGLLRIWASNALKPKKLGAAQVLKCNETQKVGHWIECKSGQMLAARVQRGWERQNFKRCCFIVKKLSCLSGKVEKRGNVYSPQGGVEVLQRFFMGLNRDKIA